MLMFIIGMSLLYSYVMSSLHLAGCGAGRGGHAPAQVVAAGDILVMVVVLGFFLPPCRSSMTAPSSCRR
jgi:hypothetical protein